MKSAVGVVRKEWQDEEWCGCGVVIGIWCDVWYVLSSMYVHKVCWRSTV